MLRRLLLSHVPMLTALGILATAVPSPAQVTGLTLAVDKPSPQRAGAVLTFTADATGAGGPWEYRFWISKGGAAYEPVTDDYAADKTLDWQPWEADCYRVMVCARTPGNPAPCEKSAVRGGYWVVTDAPVTAVTLRASKASPQQVGTAVTFTGAATVAEGTAEYQFWLARGAGAFRLVKDYGVPGDSWTPAAGDMDIADGYVVKVNARTAGSIAPFEKSATKAFVMVANAPLEVLLLGANKTSPQDLAAVGTVTFTAEAKPGATGAAVEYRFWLLSSAGGGYEPVGDATSGYSAATEWHWTPAAAGAYKVMVYARTLGSGAAYEKLKVAFFSIYAGPPSLGAVRPSWLTSPAGATRTLTAVYRNLADRLKTASILVSGWGEANAILARYDHRVGKLYLMNDAGTAYVGNCAPGAAQTLENSQGMLDCAATTVTLSGGDATIAWSMTPKAAFASNFRKDVATQAKDTSGVLVGWSRKGTWTITAPIEPDNCEGCHGFFPDVGLDGVEGTADDAPNVMGNGVSSSGSGAIPKPYDDGTWGYNVNGHGANGTAAHTPKMIFDPGPPIVYGPAFLNANAACVDCHDISLPATGSGRHRNGILNSVERKLNPSENTAHLRVDGPYPFIVAGPNAWDVQVGFDAACWLRCHASAGRANMRHAYDLVISPWNMNATPNASRFGDKGTPADGESIVYPIDSALTTYASTAGDDFAPCISCHNPHGTSILDAARNTNRMLRDVTYYTSALCQKCHP
jgi:hypothetical protein